MTVHRLLPFLWLHGTNDGMLAMETNGQPIWDNYRGGDGARRMVVGGVHNDLPTALGGSYRTYRDIVRCFVQGNHRDSLNEGLYSGFKP